RPHEIRRALLPCLHPVHHLRPGGGVPVPMGGEPDEDAARDGGVRVLEHDGLPGSPHRGLRLRVEEGRVGMGVTKPPALAAGRTSVEGYDPKVHDPYFDGVNAQLADKGFITAATDDLITWARTGSLMWMTFGLACCAVELMHASTARYDLERFGFAPRGSRPQSDVSISALTL